MNGHRRIAAVAIGAVAVLGALGLATQSGIGPLAIDTCLTNYELGGAGGDSLVTCSTTPSNVKIPNLTTHSEGLVGGCQRIINQSSSWSDCITSAKVAHLTASQKVVWYFDINYANQAACYDVDGNSGVIDLSGTNERISSFRILGGNC